MDGCTAVVELEKVKDLDHDRFIEYPQFCEFIRHLPLHSRSQCFYLLSGMTGFRPIETSRLTTDHLLFDDPQRPIILNKITKTKRKYYYDSQGRVLATKIVKIKRRVIPLWVREYILDYLRKNIHALKPAPEGGFYLFSSPTERGTYISTRSWDVNLSRWRHKLVEHDPQKWAWVFDTAFQKVNSRRGCVENVYRLSLYSFRKSRATWHGMELLAKGVSDVLLNVSHFMGHEKIQTTYTYLKALISERYSGFLEQIRPPDLSQPIITEDNTRQTKLTEMSWQPRRHTPTERPAQARPSSSVQACIQEAKHQRTVSSRRCNRTGRR